jgi:hypothetical protein
MNLLKVIILGLNHCIEVILELFAFDLLAFADPASQKLNHFPEICKAKHSSPPSGLSAHRISFGFFPTLAITWPHAPFENQVISSVAAQVHGDVVLLR